MTLMTRNMISLRLCGIANVPMRRKVSRVSFCEPL